MEYRNVHLTEYSYGTARVNAKYIQRFGTPGSFRYIYPSNRYTQLPRKVQSVFKRIAHRAGRWLKGVQAAYGATGFNVKPKTWHTAVINLSGDNGASTLIADLTKHKVSGYKTRATHKVGRLNPIRSDLRKKGVLRYR